MASVMIDGLMLRNNPCITALLWSIIFAVPFASAQNWNFLGIADKGRARALAGDDLVLPALGTKAALSQVSMAQLACSDAPLIISRDPHHLRSRELR